MNKDPLAPRPIEVTIAGRGCRLSYPMHAVNLYLRETARIERSRPKSLDPDPCCVCGARKSQHEGPSLIRVSKDNLALLCPRFRPEDPLLGDSLFLFESWLKIDLNSDPERWLACLWSGLHERQADGTWTAPFTLDELEEKLGLCAETRSLTEKMFEALAAWMPKEAKAPNATAPGEPAPDIQSELQTRNASTPGPESGTVSPPTSS